MMSLFNFYLIVFLIGMILNFIIMITYKEKIIKGEFSTKLIIWWGISSYIPIINILFLLYMGYKLRR